MKKIFLSLLLLICFFFHSCSRMDIAVQFASTFVTNKANDYFDLTKEQTKWLKVNFDRDFLQVQKIVFPQLAKEMIKISEVISSKSPIEPTFVMTSYERLKNLFFEGLRMFSPNAVLFSDKLGPDQISFFQKEFDKKMLEIKENESSRNSYKRMKKHFDSWMGVMTSKQKEELETFTKANPPLTSEKVYNRQLLAHEFIKSYPETGNRHRFTTKLLTQFDQVYSGRFSKLARERSNRIVVMVASILNKMTEDQRETIVTVLRDRANQLIKISKG